jgi:hypothetical protein
MLGSKFVIVKISLCTFMAEFLLFLQIATAHSSTTTNIFPLSSSIDPPGSLKPPQCCAPVFLAPISISGNNVYVSWSSNKSEVNFEVMFRASTDNGKTFGPKINLSNTPRVDSLDPSIAASGDNVYVSWWERNQTMNEPILRISNDNGKTFGPLMHIARDGTIDR